MLTSVYVVWALSTIAKTVAAHKILSTKQEMRGSGHVFLTKYLGGKVQRHDYPSQIAAVLLQRRAVEEQAANWQDWMGDNE